MENNPERFIGSSTDHSWLIQATWADALVIQAVTDALNLTLHITQSYPGLASVQLRQILITDTSNNIGSVRSETDATVINIGHLHVPIVLFNQSTTEEALQPNYLDAKCTAD